MPVFPIGDQRVGIERNVQTLDGDDNPVFDDLGGPVYTVQTLWVDRALFQGATPTETTGFAQESRDMALAVLPVSADRVIPAVDADGDPAPLPFFTTAGRPAIDATARLIHNGLRYEMRGDAVLEQDIRGRADHVFCSCERMN
jgi:hypothetical protein